MTTPTPNPPGDPLRALLADADPARDIDQDDMAQTWARIVDGLAIDGSQAMPAATAQELGSFGKREIGRPSSSRRHWQAGLLVAAGVATLALAAATVLPGLGLGSGSGSDPTAESSIALNDGDDAALPSGRDGSNLLEDKADAPAAADTAGGSTAAAPEATDPTLVRTASVIVGTEDPGAARDRFVAAIQALGGTLVSETVTSKGVDSAVASSGGIAEDRGLTYPGYPSGPGIWLTVKVPAAAYDQTLVAAKSAGEVAQLQQSSYDVGAQVTDVRARIVVLTASLKRLQGLLGDADGVSDVIRLEDAIAQRQAELDSLLAQQRDLADQTQMSQVSLTLLSPDDAAGAVDPDPQLTWWESFVEGLGQFWSWLGQVLLILSPLLIVGSLLWWARRRRARRPGNIAPAPADGGTAPEAT